MWKMRCRGKSEKTCCSASCSKTPGRRAEINLKEKDLFCLVISEAPVHVEWFCCFCTMIRHNTVVSRRVAYLMAKNQRSEMMKRMGRGQDMVPKTALKDALSSSFQHLPSVHQGVSSSIDQFSGGDRTLVISHFPKVQPLNIVILVTFIT